ncbi:RsbT co-antagonist protein RsbRA [Salirhabdus salicampi]|uniref:RsbT co-antagonist protein RsbRA n=1 Tax=Salirhabdus salicampi TaxID=476102 RepID=UPI0020C3FB74|nr:RsbT co-antagonist protein RsbRA [Salirhabdus salicampi]MCP8618089.1 RsbT co-antagonist protein RsbRA [Salirhabdus salicampi]
MDTRIQDIVLENSDEIKSEWLNEVEKTHRTDDLPNISTELYNSTNKDFVDVIFLCVQNRGSTQELQEFSERLIKLGWPLSYLTIGIQSFRRVTVNFLLKDVDKQVEKSYFVQIVQEVDLWIDPIINYLVNEYSGSWENTFSLQKLALKELSAPLIPVMEGITVMPLIGTIDTDRAKLIMENLLDGVIENRAEVVLIDITGVPVVDTMVAHHIIQAAEAVRLIGAKCILVGIRPEIAQTIVNLGIDLSKFPTKSSLSKGFQSALEFTNRKIIHTQGDSLDVEQIIDSLGKE